MIKGNQPIQLKDFSKGLITRGDYLKGDLMSSPDCMDVRWDFDGRITKRLGSSTTNAVVITSLGAGGWIIDSSQNLSTNISAYWKLDEQSGTRFDSAGTNNLIDINTTGNIVGIRGNAALFVATASNGLTIPTTTSLETGNVNFTMAGWVYLNSTSTSIERTIISKRDPDIDSLTALLLHCNGAQGSGSFPDSSPSAHTMTTGGTASVDTSQSVFGGGSLRLGTNAYLTTPTSTDFDFGTGDFTAEAWIRFNTIMSDNYFFGRSVGNAFDIRYNKVLGGINVLLNGASYTFAWSPNTATWYQLLVSRNATNLRSLINGTQIGATQTSSDDINPGTELVVGANANKNTFFDGWMDEIRLSKGIARYVANFTTLAAEYGPINYEYWLYVNTNQQATFRVSSTGTNNTATVQASSFGALNTSTWYSVVAWHSNNSHIGVSVNLSATTSPYVGGLKVGAAPFTIGAFSDGLAGKPQTFADSRVDEVGFWKRVLSAQNRADLYGGGSGNTLATASDPSGWASFDFGASSIRWLTVCAGTGIFSSSNLGTTFVNIATTRTATFQYLNRSKNVLIATSDAYDPPLYWAGSAGTFAQILAVNSAPATKFSINYNGFLILLNSSTRKRGFFYADENLQLTDPWTNSFDIPSSADDEITAAFVLNKFMYISTRYTIFRVQFVGGNPDWSYLKIKDFGYVPRTVKVVSLKGGQVAVGLDWARRLRVFDGFDDLYVSDNVENHNELCEFAMNNISQAGSGLTVSFAENDIVNQEYRIALSIGEGSSLTTHHLLLNNRTLAFYPYSNQNFSTMCMAESNLIPHLMAFDRSGFCHILNSGNLDVKRPINEHYDSPVIFKGVPESVSKNNQVNLYFSVTSSGTLYYQERFDLSNSYGPTKTIKELLGTESVIKNVRSIDIPTVQNTYQFRLTSSSGTADPWETDRIDLIGNAFGIGRGGL